MKQKRNKQGKFRKSYIGKLLLILVVTIIGAGVFTGNITVDTTENKTIYEVPIVKEVKKIVKSLSSETDDAVKEAQKKVQKEREQLLSEIANLQVKQEKKVERLKELESLGFTPESN